MKAKKSNGDLAPGVAGVMLFAGSPLGERLASLLREGSGAQRRLAEFVLRHPLQVSAGSIEDFARASGVSAPTISRFARELDLGGFAELRAAVAETMQALLNPVAKLRLQLDRGGNIPRGAAMLDAIKDQVGRIDADQVASLTATIAAEIVAARQVHVMGFGLSAHVAALLVLGLQPFCPNVAGVVEFGGTEVAAGRLMGIKPRDLLIAITFPRYATEVVRLTRYARDRGARIAVLTDSAASPLVPLADHLMLAPAEHPTLTASMTGAVAIVETLVATVMLSDPANAEKAALLGDAIGAYLLAP